MIERAKRAVYNVVAPRARIEFDRAGKMRRNLAERVVYWLERHP